MKAKFFLGMFLACFFFSFFSYLGAFRFLATSDTHVGASKPSDVRQQDMKIEQMPQMFEQLNFPSDVKALIVAGDLTQSGREEQVCNFNNLWRYPFEAEKDVSVYLCHGNHDKEGKKWWNPKNTPAMEYIKQKHGSLNYSFDINGVRFICLGEFPEELSSSCGISCCKQGWLQSELAKAGEDKPIVIFFHYNIVGGFSDWWTKRDKDKFFKTIEDYNIKLIITGHKHETFSHVWRGRIPTVCVGGEYFAICEYREDEDFLDVSFCNSRGGIVDYNGLLRNDYQEEG